MSNLRVNKVILLVRLCLLSGTRCTLKGESYQVDLLKQCLKWENEGPSGLRLITAH